MIKVLFICHGNICRSPMAEFIMKSLIRGAADEERFEIASAATSSEEIWNGVGNPVYPPAAAELGKHGIGCAGKSARQICREDYGAYDLLICMDRNNVGNLRRIIGSDPEKKVHLLLDFAGRQGQSVADPWYTEDFETAYRDIDEGVRGLLNYLRKLNTTGEFLK